MDARFCVVVLAALIGPGLFTGPAFAVQDRNKAIDQYLEEFCSPDLRNIPKFDTAIKDVLRRIPKDAFLIVMDRRRPVIFTEIFDSGTARFAGSSEFIVLPQDKPCCSEGFTILKLSMGLGQAKDPAAIEGIIAHELAHRVLDHIRRGHVSCQAEREANALIKQWGFGKEFKEASKTFGQRKGDPAGCQEKTS